MSKRANGACVSTPEGLFNHIVQLTDCTEDIKTYAVTPLNEECGLIEWVDNLITLRVIVNKILRERGLAPNVSLLKN